MKCYFVFISYWYCLFVWEVGVSVIDFFVKDVVLMLLSIMKFGGEEI